MDDRSKLAILKADAQSVKPTCRRLKASADVLRRRPVVESRQVRKSFRSSAVGPGGGRGRLCPGRIQFGCAQAEEILADNKESVQKGLSSARHRKVSLKHTFRRTPTRPVSIPTRSLFGMSQHELLIQLNSSIAKHSQ
ncbi:hypothetical protein SRHO_G00114170 [Serrasalmus rhombeus]